MNFSRAARQFRSAAATRRGWPPRHRYTPALRAQAVAYWRARSAEGGGRLEIARELEVNIQSLRKWVAAEQVPGLSRVEILDQPSPTRVVVHGPRGLRIEGLDLETLAALLERLG